MPKKVVLDEDRKDEEFREAYLVAADLLPWLMLHARSERVRQEAGEWLIMTSELTVRLSHQILYYILPPYLCQNRHQERFSFGAGNAAWACWSRTCSCSICRSFACSCSR